TPAAATTRRTTSRATGCSDPVERSGRARAVGDDDVVAARRCVCVGLGPRLLTRALQGLGIRLFRSLIRAQDGVPAHVDRQLEDVRAVVGADDVVGLLGDDLFAQ